MHKLASRRELRRTLGARRVLGRGHAFGPYSFSRGVRGGLGGAIGTAT